jgi:rare lipoprotein A
MARIARLILIASFFAAAPGAGAMPASSTEWPGMAAFPATQAQQTNDAQAAPKLDRSGKTRVGKASYYAARFNGKKMADGQHMDPRGDNAASKTLPLGTIAKVTNRENGKSAVVTIQDRGPYVQGRILDLSPSTAQKIGITETKGVAPVEVAPLAVPQSQPGAASPSTRKPAAH